MLLTHGGRFSGWGFYLLKGKPVFNYNLAGVAHYNIAAKDKLAPGAHTIVYDFKYDGGGLGKGGVGTIQVDGKTVATGRIERTLAFRLSLDETLDCGEDTGTPVSEDYHVPFKFTGELKQVTVNLKPQPLTASDEQQLQEARKLAALWE
jgi:arylsulfatase